MDTHQKRYITKNLKKLIDCTKNISELGAALQADFIGHSTWQRLRKENADDYSFCKEIYMECMKTPKYEALIEIFEDNGNPEVVSILESISEAAMGNRVENMRISESERSDSSVSVRPTTNQPFPDFVMNDKHVNPIANLVIDKLSRDQWEEIKTVWLSQKMKNDAGKTSSMKLDIYNCLRVWISGTKREERVFSNFVKAFEDSPMMTEHLEEKGRVWKNLT